MTVHVFMCVCVQQVCEDTTKINVFMAHCQALQHSGCTNHSNTLTHRLCHISTLGPSETSYLFFPPFFLSLYAYHFITLSAASVVAGTQGETVPLLAHAICHTAALMRSAPDSYREKPCGDNLGDSLITAFHQSPLRPAPLQFETDKSPLFPFLPYLTFSSLSNM